MHIIFEKILVQSVSTFLAMAMLLLLVWFIGSRMQSAPCACNRSAEPSPAAASNIIDYNPMAFFS